MRSDVNFSSRDKFMVEYAIFAILGTAGIFFLGIFAAAYISGIARDRDHDRARELSSIFDGDIE
jgi:hypothetical protein